MQAGRLHPEGAANRYRAELMPRHAAIIERMVTACNATGPLVTDAALAALAIEHGATLASTDQDFRRFPEVRWINPLG